MLAALAQKRVCPPVGGSAFAACYAAGLTRADRIRQLEGRLAELREANRRKEGQLRARKQRLEAAERARERKLRTRRLILMGSCMEHAAERDPEARDRLLRKLDGFLARDRDRELFDLPPREASRAAS